MSFGSGHLGLVNADMLRDSGESVNAWVGENSYVGNESARLRAINLWD